MIHRADVVIARFPYVGGAGSKVRPAVVVQCGRLNGQIDSLLQKGSFMDDELLADVLGALA